MTETRLPQDLALLVRIQSVDHAGLLSRDQRSAAVRQIDEDRRRPEVEIRTLGLRAVLNDCGTTAGDIVGVAFRHLARPENLSGIEAESQKGIRGAGRRIGIAVPRGYVECAFRSVNSWGAPHSRARRPVKLNTFLILTGGLRLLGNGKGLPNGFTSRCVQRRNASTKPAA